METQYKPATEENRNNLYEDMGKAICELEVAFRLQLPLYEMLNNNTEKKSFTNSLKLKPYLMLLMMISSKKTVLH